MSDMSEEIIRLAETLVELEDYDEILKLINHRISIWFSSDVVLITMLNPITHATIQTIGRKELS